jgi:hypothetical protein
VPQSIKLLGNKYKKTLNSALEAIWILSYVHDRYNVFPVNFNSLFLKTQKNLHLKIKTAVNHSLIMERTPNEKYCDIQCCQVQNDAYLYKICSVV